MNAPINLRPTLPPSVTPEESPRDAAMSNATRIISNLLRCILWLIRHGIYVTGFKGRKDASGDSITVTVAASPYLFKLFSGECAWQQRRQEGALVIFTWFAIRYGCRIEWEEVCAFPAA